MKINSAGVPQIILPQWLDLYDYAVRVEWLGHGIYANKGFPAQIDAAQLARAFVRVLTDEGGALKMKAVEISKACKRGGGVYTVAQTILNAATA
jgi:UDP:flavonoid glycosyltransferase YjiC (YdhE family)